MMFGVLLSFRSYSADFWRAVNISIKIKHDLLFVLSDLKIKYKNCTIHIVSCNNVSAFWLKYFEQGVIFVK